MSKKCIYCREPVDDERVVDFCDRCGKSVWGEKMFQTIIDDMERARDNEDLCHSQHVELEKSPQKEVF